MFNVEEHKLLDHVKTMALLGYGLYGLTNVKLQQLGGELAHAMGKRKTPKPLSNSWLYSFLGRWREQIATLKPSSLDTNRAKSSTPEVVDTYFDNLDEMTKYKLHDKPQFIYNIDETGIQPEHRPPNIIAPVNSKPQAITSPRSTTTTVIGCVSASGTSLPPFYVFKGKRFNQELMNGAAPGSRGVMSDSGWSNSDIFRGYLSDHFLPNIGTGEDGQHILLIYDGHASHISSSLIEWAKSHNIILFVLPAHTSHILQPLDVGVFGPFKRYYYSECATFMRDNIGQKVTKYEMCHISSQAYIKAMTPVNIISSFKKTGIFPLSREVISRDRLFPSIGFTDNAPVHKVTALISGPEAMERYLSEKSEKTTTDDTCCSNCKQHKASTTKPKPGGKAITEATFVNDLAEHEQEKANPPTTTKPKKTAKKTPKKTSKTTTKTTMKKTTANITKKTTNSTTTNLSQQPSTSGITSNNQRLAEDSDMDIDDPIPESDLCCVCKKFSPPNLNSRPYLKIVNWANCDKCGHWVHLSFCTPQSVIRRNDSFLCQHCM
ncbi:MAG: hypothetical protein ABW185_25105 [Sedimenticola sp.]